MLARAVGAVIAAWILSTSGALAATPPMETKDHEPFVEPKQQEEKLSSLPIPRSYVGVEDLYRPHHHYPAWDIAVPVGTPALSMRKGVVLRVSTSGACGIGVVMEAIDGFVYTYCHGSALMVSPGRTVEPGDTLLLTGSTGHSTGPHLHLQVRGSDGSLRCPQALVASEYYERPMSPWGLATVGCYYIPPPPPKPVVVEKTKG